MFEPRLRERDFGDYELREDNNYNDVWKRDVNEPSKLSHNVEPVASVLDRGLEAIADLEANYDHRNILLVGHGDVLQILLSFHHGIHPRFHRSIASVGNADIRSLAKLELVSHSPAA